MLIRLLRTHFAPYKRLVALLIALQAVQVSAALVLPRLNATIIDQGVLTGDQGFIRSHGALMLLFTLVQGVFAAAAVYVGARVAMSVGRDLRTNLFHQVTGFSAREVG
ncbi:MAG TPA: ABC transporter ATP-binding protein, partial [Acidimicrobiales bacterium]|nr:ABC transporter ATP-binding protein [Acidimicrobiales bacterium]